MAALDSRLPMLAEVIGLRCATAVLLVLASGVALAQDAPPKIDGAKYCDAVSGMFNSATEAQKMAVVWLVAGAGAIDNSSEEKRGRQCASA
jgi:hypothetical protein